MVKIAMVGCGHWGKNLCRNFAELGALGGIIDGDPAIANAMAQAHGAPIMTFEEALANPEITAVALATPAETHAALALRAIAAGKGVYVEKPLALTVDDAEQVIAASIAAGTTLMVGHLLQYHPAFQALRSLVREGALGKVQYVYSNRMSLGKFRIEENVLWSFAPHDFSMLLSLVDADLVDVTAQGASFVTSGIADWCTAQLQFANGTRGHVQVSWLHPFKEHRLVVIGDTAMAVFDDSQTDFNRKVTIYPFEVDRSGHAPAPKKGEPQHINIDEGEPLKAECQHFIDCLASGDQPRTDGAEALAVLKALRMAETALAQSLAAQS